MSNFDNTASLAVSEPNATLLHRLKDLLAFRSWGSGKAKHWLTLETVLFTYSNIISPKMQ